MGRLKNYSEERLLAVIEETYEKYCETYSHLSCKSRILFTADELFGFTTYEDAVLEQLGLAALSVCSAINDGKTFDMIESEQGNLWYLIMVNMPFFRDKINWGTSIRGAWWDFEICLKEIYLVEDGLYVDDVEFVNVEWKDFIKALLKFNKESARENNNER